MCSHVRPLFPGKADQVERRLAWEAKHSWCQPSGLQGRDPACYDTYLEESSDVSIVDPPPGPKQPSIWSHMYHPPVGE